MRIEEGVKLDFDDVFIRPKRSNLPSRAKVELVRSYTTLNSKQTLVSVPVIAANMDAVGTFAMAKALSEFGMLTCLHKFYSGSQLRLFFNSGHIDGQGAAPVNKSYYRNAFYTLGISDEDIQKLKAVARDAVIDKICIDVANGYTEYFQNKVREVRDAFPTAVIMAGNVATPEMVQELLISGGADIVKIGIGPGSVCETRRVSGVGYPQLSAIIECADAAHGLGGLVCADGGCKTPGDVAKAFGAGADFVMLGGMFAGHDECEGEWEEEWEVVKQDSGVPKITGSIVRKSMKFYGMSSREAMEKYNGGVAEHRASEGKCVKIPYKGPVKNTVQQILGGLRSACTYVGASTLKDLSKCTTFVRCR